MTKQRAEELLSRCVEYIHEALGVDAYDVLVSSLGFTESELDEVALGEEDDQCNMVFCEDVTGVIGSMFANDVSSLPDEAVKHLQDAYIICAQNLSL